MVLHIDKHADTDGVCGGGGRGLAVEVGGAQSRLASGSGWRQLVLIAVLVPGDVGEELMAVAGGGGRPG